MLESTALGAALLAGIGAGIWKDRGDVPAPRSGERVFRPRMAGAERRRRLASWRMAVERLLG
jgi:glycerol kinase